MKLQILLENTEIQKVLLMEILNIIMIIIIMIILIYQKKLIMYLFLMKLHKKF